MIVFYNVVSISPRCFTGSVADFQLFFRLLRSTERQSTMPDRLATKQSLPLVSSDYRRIKTDSLHSLPCPTRDGIQASLRSFPSFPSLNFAPPFLCSNEVDLRLNRPPDLQLTPRRYHFRSNYDSVVAKAYHFAAAS
jgi:hypothetical protein